MDIVWIVLLVFGILVALALLVGGAFFLIMRLRSGEPLSIDIRALVRIYLYVGIIAGLLVFTQGASELIKAGAAGIASKEFSYYPVWVELPGDETARPQHPLELADRRRPLFRRTGTTKHHSWRSVARKTSRTVRSGTGWAATGRSTRG